MGNKELKDKYDQMHTQGATAWFSDGKEEREAILKMGEPWDRVIGVLEIGCGEGELAARIHELTPTVTIGLDYSKEAINKAKENYQHEELLFLNHHYREFNNIFHIDRLVMQGVLEHLDDPFGELKWMMDNLLSEHGDVITSSPCFLNPRGIVWMTLDMLGAVMSKTDLHYLNPFQFECFCKDHGYRLVMADCDYSWGAFSKMCDDLEKRIPLALDDGGIAYNQEKVDKFISWLWNTMTRWHSPTRRGRIRNWKFPGATMVYKITKG